MGTREAEVKSLAEALAEVITLTFDKKGDIKFTAKPAMERREIVEWNKKMTITGMEKFNGPTYISFVHYYLNELDKQKQNTLGAIILFITESRLQSFVSKLGFPRVDDEIPDEMKDGCGKICNEISEAFKAKLKSLGYPQLISSPVENYRNNVPQGVGFCYKEYDKFEIVFSIENQKVLFAEITMGVMPRSR